MSSVLWGSWAELPSSYFSDEGTEGEAAEGTEGTEAVEKGSRAVSGPSPAHSLSAGEACEQWAV